MEVIWEADRPDYRRQIVPALVSAALVGVVGYALDADEADGPWFLVALVPVMLAVAWFRYRWWTRVVASRRLAVSEDRLLVVGRRRKPAGVAWADLREVRLRRGSRRPEWQRTPSFAWFTGHGFDAVPPVIFTSDDLYAVTDDELARLTDALARVCAERGIAFTGP